MYIKCISDEFIHIAHLTANKTEVFHIHHFYPANNVMKEKERAFLRVIRRAAFANPFDLQRGDADREALALAGQRGGDGVLMRLVAEVAETLEGLRQRGSLLATLTGEDRELVEYGHLFHIFHLFCDDYDQHIHQQTQKGAQCCSVTFAKKALGTLQQAGFSPGQSLHFFALFFQMRRAYYFISRIVGGSHCMQNLRKALWQNIFSQDISLYNSALWNRMEDFSTLLLGETGVGKGMAAAAVGCSGFIPFDDTTGFFTESFVAAFTESNLSQYAEELIESELFGHRKGAFTGAMENHQGILRRCSPCGAIFLDEIGDVSLPVQIKLLKVLQERRFSPVGSYQIERFSGRVIAATNQDLTSLRQRGKFRDDFYYRLCSDSIEIPPLRQRLKECREELGQLLEVVVRRIVGEKEGLAARLEEYILSSQPQAYPWPGNIRELEQCVRQYLLRGEYHWQQSQSEESPLQALNSAIAAGTLTAADLQSSYCRLLYSRLGTYEAVAKTTALDRRTVKKYVTGFSG